MLQLGVNIDHIATLRQARYKTADSAPVIEPDVVAAAQEVEAAGAHGITVHLREDRRHIQDVIGASSSLRTTIARLRRAGIVVSLFIDPDSEQIRAAADVGAQFIELHTGTYANHGAGELPKLISAAELAHKLGLRVNAGHGLNYQNTTGIRTIPHLETLNTGHSIISHAVFVGLRLAVREMLALLNP